MRLTRIAAATLVAGSLTFAGTGIALADTVTATPAISSSASVVTQSGGTITLGSSSVKPGASVSLSGMFTQPGTGSISVTSPAFAGSATLRDASPTSFDGFAQIANSAKPGSYTVTATRGTQTATATLTVVGSGPAPVPPAPIHHGGTGTTTGGSHGSSSGSTTGTHHSAAATGADTTGTDTTPAAATSADAPSGTDVLPWALGGAAILLAGGAYVFRARRTSGGNAPAARDEQDPQTAPYDREPRTEVMHRR
ncbi:hypothetical protein GCM10023201_32850 [Actinomycetospora corticicola]|uniref:LPXTG-motif cell wall-anchored protein n=1 Tax=Actinomycetospora corticicola TaxID=663602 RepID=A0A7Y9DSG4_9PSEU|nr:hypothetical protein [Actinomycetospora corticicola]NYD34590.1 hypothetical protein [Actinomycetospora corticicola]